MKTIADAIGRIQKTLNTPNLKSALARMDATLARADADFKEGDHPRDADGKFAAKAEISGAAAHGVEAYKKALKPGAAMKPQGLIKSMIRSGQYSEKDIWEAAKDTFDLTDDKKKWVRHSYYKLKHESGDKNFPPLPKESTVEVKPKAITVSEAIKDKDKKEYNWHNSMKAWDNAPQEILRAVANTAKLKNISNKTRSSSYYMRHDHSVNMKHRLDPNGPDARRTVLTWRHEFGHAMDYNASGTAQSEKLNVNLAADLAQRSEEIGKIYKDHMDQNRKNDSLYGLNEGLYFSDFVCALTRGQHGYGHPPSYFAQPGARQAEMFANYVALISHKDGGEYQKLLHEMAPESCKAFDDIIKKMGS